MKWVAVAGLLILSTLPAWTQQSSEAGSEWPIRFGELEWASLEAQVQAELERTAREAAAAAVEPYLKIESDLRREIEKKDASIRRWKIATGVSAGVGVGVLALFLIQMAVAAR